MTPGKTVPVDKRRTYAGNKRSTFCANVQSRRLELSITQADLAVMIGTTPARISEMEAGRFPRDETRIVAIAAALGVTLDWLFGREEP